MKRCLEEQQATFLRRLIMKPSFCCLSASSPAHQCRALICCSIFLFPSQHEKHLLQHASRDSHDPEMWKEHSLFKYSSPAGSHLGL